MKLYVPNTQKWLDFFERVSTGKTQLSQSGTGRRPRVITIDQSKPFSLKAVLPAEQTAAQAKSELEREGINPKRVADAMQSTTGQGTKRKASSTPTRRNKKPKTTSKSKGSRKSTSKSKGSRKTKTQDKKGYQDIFEIK
jgi:hypothetical protein